MFTTNLILRLWGELMNRCKECVFFEKGERNEHFGKCKNYKKLDYGTSNSKKTDWHEIDITDDMLLYMDAEWYSAEIEVGKNFGCIHFEKM